MKVLAAVAAGILLVGMSQTPDHGSRYQGEAFEAALPVGFTHPTRASAPKVASKALTEVIQQYCIVCHNDQLRTGNLSLEGFDVAKAAEMAEIGEKVVGKLRLSMMPPPGMPRPGGDTLTALAETLETVLDEAAATAPDPGRRMFQRLTRAEYANSIRELLGLEIDMEAYLPPDTKSDNFDNIADVQMASATVIDAYLNAASEITRLAAGDIRATPKQATYRVSRTVSQLVHIEGTPPGTRGGLSVLHTFPADGEYVFSSLFYVTLAGAFFGKWMRGEQLEISIDGERVALIELDRFMHEEDPGSVTRSTDPVFVRAGQRRVAAAFVRTFEGPAEDIVSPVRQSMLKPQAGYNDGQTHLPHLFDFMIQGPRRVTGISETPTRQRIFTCRPMAPSEERPCAHEIIDRLGSQAYRRPLTDQDRDLLMTLYEEGTAEGGFEIGVRTALQGILSSPDFVFRWEELSTEADREGTVRLDDADLAARLSFFLWGGPPDAELMEVARKGELSDARILEQQVQRMLADSRSEALSTRFAAQWLRLQDAEKVIPTVDWPNFDRTIKYAMLRETELFFTSILREDRSVLDLLTADHTFVNEDLARHYGIPGVAGSEFQRVRLAESERRGLLGQGSVLLLTSHSDRTSPVLRGKWIMEVLLNSPPPPPPPNVPPFEQTEGVDMGRALTVKERMQLHRANPVCQACHQFIDPLGLALENFDVTGEWRIKDSGNPVDPSGTLWDGTELNGVNDLRQALLRYETPLLRAFTKNLLAYALGRRVEYYDQPTIREIIQQAGERDYRISSFILGVTKSDAFQKTKLSRVAAEADGK